MVREELAGVSGLVEAASGRLVVLVRSLVISDDAGGACFRAAGAILARRRGLVDPSIRREGDRSGRREGYDGERREPPQKFFHRVTRSWKGIPSTRPSGNVEYHAIPLACQEIDRMLIDDAVSTLGHHHRARAAGGHKAELCLASSTNLPKRRASHWGA